LAHLVTAARKTRLCAVTCLADCLFPHKFDIPVKAAKELCGFTEVTSMYKMPSLALKRGLSLKECCAIATSCSIKENDDVKCTLLTDFMYLSDKESSAEVSSVALCHRPELTPVNLTDSWGRGQC